MLFLALADFTLTYERSGFLDTGNYAEALAFCEGLAKRSPYAKVVRYGTTPEGRPMIALVVSKSKAFSPEAQRKSPRPLIWVNNGIHAGEIEGKDATLILAREMLTEGKHADLLAGADWVLLPVYNVDGHERRSPYQRINQNGPRIMGWRATSQNINLNRDYVKADTAEAQNWLRLFHRYRPDFIFDDHTTDGADFRYAAMLSVPNGPVLPPATAAFSSNLYDAVKKANDARGFLTSPYFELQDRAHPEAGISVDDFSARYTHGYMTAWGRPSMLIETHMLKDYRTRVETTYWTLIHTAHRLVQEAKALKALNAAADRPIQPGERVILSSKLTDERRPFTFLGWRYAPKASVAAGGEIAAWVHEPVDTSTTVRDRYVADKSALAPAGYAVPAGWTDVIARLRLHGLPVRILKAPATDSFESYRFTGIRFASQPFEGRFQPTYTTSPLTETRTLPAGTAIVPASRLAMQLLEPEGPDSLMRWGLFNNVFETKEYFEDYAMAPIGDAMLEKDAQLRKEFEAWLVENPKAGSRQRLAWLFERSPYRDAHLNVYPVVRLNGAQMRLR